MRGRADVSVHPARAAMVAGFLAVPFFGLVAPALPVVGATFAAVEEMAPSFLASALVGAAVSLADGPGRRRLADAEEGAEVRG